MAKFADVNTIGTGAAAAFKLKEVLKLAGWTVPRSSDGTTYNASGDQITHSGSGAGGMANSRAWFVVREPGGRREWCWQRATSTNADWRVKYSALSRFTGGSPAATVVPAAADQQTLIGGGSDAAPTFTAVFVTDGTYRVHIIANSTPIGGVYPFYLFCTVSPGSAQTNGWALQEPMAPGSYDAADADPCVVQCLGSATYSVAGWLAYGTGSAVWAGAIAASNSGIFAGSLPPDLVSSKDLNGRWIYTASSGGTRVKGYGSTVAARGPSRAWPATANRATDAYVYLGAQVWPYANNTEPGV